MGNKEIKRNAQKFKEKEKERLKKERKYKLLGIFFASLSATLIVCGVIFSIWYINHNKVKLPENTYVLDSNISVKFNDTDHTIEGEAGYYSIIKEGNEVAKFTLIDVPTYNEYYDIWNRSSQQKVGEKEVKIYGVRQDNTNYYAIFDLVGAEAWYLETTSETEAKYLADNMTVNIFNAEKTDNK